MPHSVLYIVATPIGNRQDMSFRAVSVLQQVDLIAAEDTRHSKQLLTYYSIKTGLISLHEHNELQRIKILLTYLERGDSIALISDAGTPLIHDPGYRLVLAVQKKGFQVIPIPGACAAITALCASGLPTDRFTFEGFLPAKSSARRGYLKTLSNEPRTMIFYESTHRIIKSLTDFVSILGGIRRATIARELTKSFETIFQDTLANLLTWIQANPNQQKGEFVIVLEGATNSDADYEKAESCRILSILLKEMPLKQAVMIATQLTGVSRSVLYQLALTLKRPE